MAVYFCETDAEVQDALDVVVGGDVVQLDHTLTFTGSYIIRDAGVIQAGQEIIIESDTPVGLLPQPGWRAFPSHAVNFAKMQTQQIQSHTNERVLSTEAGLPVNGYIVRWIEFLPSYKGGSSQIQLGRNDSTQTTYSQVAYNIKFDQCIVRGHPISGQRVGFAVHAAGCKIHNCYIFDHKTLGGEAVAIGGGNFTGTLEIINCYIECVGIPFILGGADNRIQTQTTVTASPAPTLTTMRLGSVADLSVGQYISILVGGNAKRRHPKVTAINGTDVTFEAIDTLPDVPGNVAWGANPSGITVSRCHIKKPLSMRGAVIGPAPAITQATVVPAAVGLAAGDYFAVVQALHDDIGYQSNTYWSDISAEAQFTVTETSEIDFAWTAPTTPIPTTKSRLYRYQKDGGGNRINARYYTITSATTYTDTDLAGTAFTTFTAASKWTSKNLGEFKIGSNWTITKNVFENCWDMGGGSHSFWGKCSNQVDWNGHTFAQVDDVLWEWNLTRGTLGGYSLSMQRAFGNQPKDFPKKPERWVFRQSLVYDSGPPWADAGRPTSVYGTIIDGACDDLEMDHLTIIHPSGSGAVAVGVDSATFGYWNNLKIRNSLWMRASFGFKAGGVAEGKNTLNTASNNTVDFDRNVIAGASAATYEFAGKTNYTPTVDVFEAQFEDYGGGVDGDYRLKAGSLYRNAATDGTDIGCNVAELMVQIDGVVEGAPEGDPGAPVVTVDRRLVVSSAGRRAFALR